MHLEPPLTSSAGLRLVGCLAVAAGQALEAQARLADTASPGFAGMKRQFPQPKDPATLGRKTGSVRGRLLTDLKKKTKQAERMLGNAASVSASAKKKGQEAETLAKDSAKVRAMEVTTVMSLFLGLWKDCPIRAALL